MNAGEHDARACEVTEGEARQELERLLTDQRFHSTERSRDILRYIAERHFEGRSEGVKAYSIAIDVLGRACNFDPSLDPIVRIELSRLRSSLSQYYEAYGAESGVAIHLPRGRYIAVFSRAIVIERPTHAELAEAQVVPSDARAEPSMATARFAPVRKGGAERLARPLAFALIACAAVSVGWLWYGSLPIFVEKPTVAVTMFAADERLQAEANVTRDTLMTALTQFQTLTLSSATQLANAKQLSSVLRPSVSNAYEVELKYYGDRNDRSVWWQIVGTGSGDVLKSGLERVNADGKTPEAVRDELVAALSRRFATTRGVINNIETHGGIAGALGNSCVLQAEYELDDGSPADIAKTVGCLEKTIAIKPGDADATAVLSRALMAEAAGAADPSTMNRAIYLANRAASLAPSSDRAQIALMMAQFYNGRTEAAISAGNRAMALNSNNPDVAAKLGMVLFLSGYWDAGVSLAQDARRSVDAVPRDAVIVLALDAYRRKDWSEASLLAEQVNCSDFVVRALRAASLGQLGSEQAAQRLADIQRSDPDFETSFQNRLASRGYQIGLAASIEEGLTKAGAQFKTRRLASAF